MTCAAGPNISINGSNLTGPEQLSTSLFTISRFEKSRFINHRLTKALFNFVLFTHSVDDFLSHWLSLRASRSSSHPDNYTTRTISTSLYFILNSQGIPCSAWDLELTQTSVRSRARLTKSSGNLAGSLCWRWEKGTSCAVKRSLLKCGPRKCLR